jgi:hypothetical protein
MLWDAASARRIMQFKGHSGTVNAVAISIDGAYVATGGSDYHAIIWDIFTGRMVWDLICGSARVTAIAFSPDGTQLLTGSEDGKAKLWDIAGGEVVLRLQGHDKALAACIFTADGTKVVTASVDGTVSFWDRSNGTLLATLHHLARGFLWTAPPDEAAPSGWFWTDCPELLSVLRSGMEGESPVALPHEEPDCAAYLDSGMYNRRDLTMSRLNDFPTYQREIERIVGRIGDRQLGWELNRRPALTGGK